ncbi:hypothetical protein [Hymenobacter sp. 5414T-23]|uniref:hypothetical protein n=1 Tax=Hymenobacter sp. 5414T-23 TaxID=2932252 RepID=UPI001FD026CB|nr:hypothetical protein [Hymenobacter sp. 5414T-23]UOQ80828.1 hypothetical protein MUN83_18750 [Hymenobacter sp. 5414T-23]
MANFSFLTGKRRVLGGLLLLLLLPAIQTWLNIKIFRTSPLAGYSEPAPRPLLAGRACATTPTSRPWSATSRSTLAFMMP